MTVTWLNRFERKRVKLRKRLPITLHNKMFVYLIILIVFVTIPYPLADNIQGSHRSIYDIIQHVGLFVNIDHKLLYSIALVESGLNPLAVGDRGQSIGIMQIHSSTSKQFGVPCRSLLFDPEINILIGALHLKMLINKFGVNMAIHAYNTGATKHRRGVRSPNYHRKVIKTWHGLNGKDIWN